MTDHTDLVAVDGRDALAVVIIRPGPKPGLVTPEAMARGISKQAAAWVLRQIADTWEREAAAETPDTPQESPC